MKTFKITVDESELRAIIDYHLSLHEIIGYKSETSERIHNLTKRLNKDTPEIEAVDPQLEAAKTEQQSSW